MDKCSKFQSNWVTHFITIPPRNRDLKIDHGEYGCNIGVIVNIGKTSAMESIFAISQSNGLMNVRLRNTKKQRKLICDFYAIVKKSREIIPL